MSFAEIIGQKRIIRLLRRALAQEHLPHSFLFTGMEGVGKKLTAFTLAKVVNCENGAAGDCCNHCVSCRKAASDNHPDINIIERDGPFIKIEQIRALKQRLRFKPLEGRYRVTIINNAQNMKIEAANALLKVLEEPPAENLIILTAYEITSLLPTIVSRCLHLPFQPLTTEEIVTHLCQVHGLEPEKAAVMAELAGGSLSRAAALLDEKQLDRRRWLLETVVRIHESPITDLLATAKAWKGEGPDLKQDLEWLKTWLRDLLVQQLEAADSIGLLNVDFAEKVVGESARFRPDHLLEMFELICTLQGAMSYNINKRLSLEALLLLLHTRATDRGGEPRGHLPAQARGPFTWPVTVGK
ncbi:MAG: DNA polymerase III subunit delta' [Deltaproteobacteria bacterium]|nr:DNA polymerase III subunit delta' [Deltaproteobacteria bacterium]